MKNIARLQVIFETYCISCKKYTEKENSNVRKKRKKNVYKKQRNPQQFWLV